MAAFLQDTKKRIWKAIDSFANSSVDFFVKDQPQSAESPYQLGDESSLWYAEWPDDHLSGMLNNSLVQKGLRHIADKYYSKQVFEIIHQASLLSKESYPSIFNIYKSCTDTLKVAPIPNVYITDKLKGINALSVETNQNKIILLSRFTTVRLSPKELSFVLGHELGHHQQGNLVGHTVNGLMNHLSKASDIFGPLLLDAIEVPLKRWCRQSEFNADRAGYLCCRDMDCVISLFAKLYESPRQTNYSNLVELFVDHPYIKTRIDRIEMFVDSLAV